MKTKDIQRGQIWCVDNCYFLILNKRKKRFKMKLIRAEIAYLGPFKFWLKKRFIKEFKYQIVRNCINCGSARIRHINKTFLADDMRCWSCK